ncbi:MAG: DUF4360 domain-containing protein [Bdellovibrionota bacterium]
MKTLVSLLSFMLASQAMADDTIWLGEPSYGGSGCPRGSASATLSPDAKSLSILFDQYTVEAGGFTGKRLDRKSCNVAIPVHVPQGFSVSVIGIDYRGFNSLPFGSRSQFNVEYFFAGTRGPRFTQNFSGPQDSDYLIENDLIARGLIWSRCGVDVILRSNSSMLVMTNGRSEQAFSSVDSMDVDAGIIYHFQWKTCN